MSRPETFQPFEMERLMSRWEQTVDYNLSESGVHPLTLGELLDGESLEALLATGLGYPHVNGLPQLRERIAALYPGATQAHVLVTVGAIEANYISLRTLLGAGDGIAVMLPNYMQIWGIARNHHYRLSTFRLRPEAGWALDLDELDSAVDSETRLIAVCNPNNPTGRALSEEEMAAVVRAAERAGAWILADEVYAGAERVSEEETPSFYGRYDKVIAVGSMSKAYGLPGLRIGWAVAPPEIVEEIWARHEYTTLSASMLANHLASIALSGARRGAILERTRGLIRAGYEILEGWLRAHAGIFELRSPDAAAIAFPRYDLEIDSRELADRLREEHSVLVVPGEVFGMERFLRISFGLPPDYLRAGLARIDLLLAQLTAEGSAG